jgi:predicted dehydrogenase
VAGFGRVWGELLKETKCAEVVALVDVKDEALRTACKNHGYSPGICFHSLREALQAGPADAVVVSTPPAFHRADVIAAMRAGLHVISEKPMADSMAACNAIARTVLETGRTYAVSQNYRYSSPMWTLANVIRSGKLGAIGQVKVDFFKGVDFGGGFRQEMPFPLIIDMAIHHFDLIRCVSGLDAVQVSGASWNPPWSNYRGDCSSTALFEMSNGARVLYNASWCAKGDFCDWNGNWHLECEKGTVTYRNGETKVYHVPKLYKVEGEEIEQPTQPPLTAQAYVLDEFVRCAQAGTQPATGAMDNIRSVAMVFAAVKAMKTGRKVTILDETLRAILEQAEANSAEDKSSARAGAHR